MGRMDYMPMVTWTSYFPLAGGIGVKPAAG
jgi:hypothetical protein